MYNHLLKTFICVADSGSFNKASECLFISPTAVMKQMDLLENHLKLKLILRTNHGVALTESGESIYKDAKHMISFSEKAVDAAREIAGKQSKMIRVGTSMFNPCNVFMDIYDPLSNAFPQLKIQIVPFEDTHTSILSVIDIIGDEIDVIVGVCDSNQWQNRCNFYQLGCYEMCIAVPIQHKLASKKRLKLSDLYRETLMMVKRGDSPLNDRLIADLEQNHPQIKIEDAEHFYDIKVYNDCAQTGTLLLNVICWQNIHPSLVTIPVDWSYTLPYGIFYPLEPKKEVKALINAIRNRLES